jgi:hypothetical protein
MKTVLKMYTREGHIIGEVEAVAGEEGHVLGDGVEGRRKIHTERGRQAVTTTSWYLNGWPLHLRVS